MVKIATVGFLQGNEHNCAHIDPFIPCLRCGVCCTKYQVRLNLVEGRCIADGLGLTWDEFADRYLEQHYPGAGSFLLRQRDRACVFVEHVDGSHIATCLVHPFKPSACREWTPSLYPRECCEGLRRYWGLTVGSLGQLQGSNEAVQVFQSFLESLARTGEASRKTKHSKENLRIF